MSGYPPPSGDRGAVAILLILVVVLVLLLIVFAALWWAAAAKTETVSERWVETLGTREAILARFPKREANAAALELERLSAGVGINIAPRAFEDRTRPDEAAQKRYGEVRVELRRWLDEQLDRAARGVAPAPPAVTAFLDERRDDLDAVRRHLLSSPTPRWEMELERLFAAPIPNLLGHLELQRVLLADALARAARGDATTALEDLEAGWRLNVALREDPTLIEQLVSMAIARMHAGALRQLGDVPAVWRSRLGEHDFRDSFMTALRMEGWVWSQLDGSEDLQSGGMTQRVLATVAKPYYRYCLAQVSDEYRERLANLTGLEVLCDSDLAAQGADLNVEVPRWNIVGDSLVPNLTNAVDRMRRLELDLELTGHVLALADPAAAPEELPSAVCPADRWLYETSPDGAMSVAFSREISWPEQTGLILPTRFTVR